MKKILSVIFSIILVTVITGCSQEEKSSGVESGNSANGEEKYTLEIGHNAPVDSHYDQWAKKFKELVENETDRVTVEIHPPGSLGAERELIESVLNGSLDVAISSDAPVVNFSDEVGALSFPFLFENEEQAYKALDGEIGEILNESLEEANIKNLAWMETGFYQIISNEPVKKLGDLEGMNIRSQESQVQIDFLKALGTNPTPVSFGELYVAADQGVVDGFTSSFATLVPNNLHEVGKYMTINNLFYSAAVTVMNNEYFDSLPEDIQDVLIESAKAAADYEREFIKENSKELRKVAEEEGMEIIEDVDIEPFREAVQPVYEDYKDKYGEIHEKIFEANNS